MPAAMHRLLRLRSIRTPWPDSCERCGRSHQQVHYTDRRQTIRRAYLLGRGFMLCSRCETALTRAARRWVRVRVPVAQIQRPIRADEVDSPSRLITVAVSAHDCVSDMHRVGRAFARGIRSVLAHAPETPTAPYRTRIPREPDDPWHCDAAEVTA